MRINVYISSTGYCSRREADRLIESNRVTIDHQPALKGMDVQDNQTVCIDGIPLLYRPKWVTIAYHKPVGIESTTDQKKPHNIIDAIGYPERVFPIGRLDKATSGLILLTNDGQIVNQILRSENAHEKEYLVQVDHPFDNQFLYQMAQGVEIYNPVRHEKTITKPATITSVTSNSFRLIIVQGLNLQIRRMCQALGYRVTSLKRLRIMNIHLGDLPIGKWRYLTENETQTLMKLTHQDATPISKNNV